MSVISGPDTAAPSRGGSYRDPPLVGATKAGFHACEVLVFRVLVVSTGPAEQCPLGAAQVAVGAGSVAGGRRGESAGGRASAGVLRCPRVLGPVRHRAGAHQTCKRNHRILASTGPPQQLRRERTSRTPKVGDQVGLDLPSRTLRSLRSLQQLTDSPPPLAPKHCRLRLLPARIRCGQRGEPWGTSPDNC